MFFLNFFNVQRGIALPVQTIIFLEHHIQIGVIYGFGVDRFQFFAGAMNQCHADFAIVVVHTPGMMPIFFLVGIRLEGRFGFAGRFFKGTLQLCELFHVQTAPF